MAEGLTHTLNLPGLPKTLAIPGTPTVNLKNVDQVAGAVVARSTDLAVDAALAIGVLVVGWMLSRWLATASQRLFARARLDETFSAFLGSVVRYLFFLMSAVAALNLLGFSKTSIVALFGAIGLAVAFALRNTLSHVAAGVMLIVNQPFKVGDFIEVGDQMGTVKRVTLFNTEINTLANQRVFIPNTQIWDNVTMNHTYNAQRMVEFKLRGSFEDRGQDVCDLLLHVISTHDKLLAKPEPMVGIDAFDNYGVVYIIRVWIRTQDYGELRYSLLETFRQAMLAHGFRMPYPTQHVRLFAPEQAGTGVNNKGIRENV